MLSSERLGCAVTHGAAASVPLPLGNTAGGRAGGSFRQRLGSQPQVRRGVPCCGATMDPYRVLEVSRDASPRELRQAYIQRIKQLHPDVNRDKDTTVEASQLNAAYAMVQGVCDVYEEAQRDVFDRPEAEAVIMFVNPFGCNVSPLDWRELQAIACYESDPSEAFLAAGVACSPSAVHYLTPAQMAAVEAEMVRMEESWSFETTAWWLADCLGRARRANYRGDFVRR
ncbi:hypothetical protein WJX72_009351 [[Myrmecia] bisecta]|uniref:J domain-containing protein n=1 Tax=[Myrmecia] bisecta TaxID=41462 RepID=A0AAW1QS71_9CHLO